MVIQSLSCSLVGLGEPVDCGVPACGGLRTTNRHFKCGFSIEIWQTAICQLYISVKTNRESKHMLWKTSKVPLSTEWNSLLCKLFLHLAVQLNPPNKTQQIKHTQTAPLPVSTPLTLQLCLQKDPLQLPLQGGGDAVLWPCQTLPAAHSCNQLLQLDPGAWWGNNKSSRVCNDAQAVSKAADNAGALCTYVRLQWARQETWWGK